MTTRRHTMYPLGLALGLALLSVSAGGTVLAGATPDTAWRQEASLITEISFPNVTKDTKVKCAGSLILTSRTAGTPRVGGQLIIEDKAVETIEVTIKQTANAGEFALSASIDFGKHLKTDVKRTAKLVLQSDKEGRWTIKVTR